MKQFVRITRSVGHGVLVVAGFEALGQPFGPYLLIGAVMLTLAYVFDVDMQ